MVSFLEEAAKGMTEKTSTSMLDGESREGRKVTPSSGRKVIGRPIPYRHRRRDINR